MEQDNNIEIFQENEIRKVWYNNEWYFVILDILEVLTNTKNAKQYWKDLKKRDPQLDKGGGKISTPLLVETKGGKQKLNCANTEGVFRIIMSVSSPKAEPLKMWLAEQGRRTIEETENPELLLERQIAIYKAKGYSDEWIERRVEATKARNRLTGEWKNRGVKEGQEYSILTATIAKGTFGLSPSEHADLKNIGNKNLRDHMTPLELIFTALGEETTRLLSIEKDAQGFNENYDTANEGGAITGKARENYEKNMKRKVVSKENFLPIPKDGKTNTLPENQIEPKK
jgi:prophage antirepressor-like protein